jgi:endonuclease YncB( thermonuclease family)
MKMLRFIVFFLIVFLYQMNPGSSHSGRTNSEGCHNKTSNGTYHCHNSKSNSSRNTIKRSQLKVVDADTIYLGEKKIRFAGIDAPEIGQTCTIGSQIIYCGIVAQKILKEKISNQLVTCVEESKPDKYQRVLAECFVNNESLSRYLVRYGYAFAFREYSTKFIQDEEFAKKNNFGLWNMRFEYPWEYRKR